MYIIWDAPPFSATVTHHDVTCLGSGFPNLNFHFATSHHPGWGSCPKSVFFTMISAGPKVYKVGPLPVINGIITPKTNKVYKPHLQNSIFGHFFRGPAIFLFSILLVDPGNPGPICLRQNRHHFHDFGDPNFSGNAPPLLHPSVHVVFSRKEKKR